MTDIRTSLVLICASHLFKVRPRVGLYYLYLKDWFAVYPREQFYITRVEDFANQKAKVASEIFDFLELRE